MAGIASDPDGTFWVAGETTGRINHLAADLTKIGDIPNPHGTGSFPNVILTRGIAFRASTSNLLVLAKDGGTFRIREVDRNGFR